MKRTFQIKILIWLSTGVFFSCNEKKEEVTPTPIYHFYEGEINNVTPTVLNPLKDSVLTFTGKNLKNEPDNYWLDLVQYLKDIHRCNEFLNDSSFTITIPSTLIKTAEGHDISFSIYDSLIYKKGNYPSNYFNIKVAYTYKQYWDTLYNYENPTIYRYNFVEIPYLDLKTNTLKLQAFLGNTDISVNLSIQNNSKLQEKIGTDGVTSYTFMAMQVDLDKYVSTPISLPDGWYDLTIKDSEGDEIFPRSKSRVYLKSK